MPLTWFRQCRYDCRWGLLAHPHLRTEIMRHAAALLLCLTSLAFGQAKGTAQSPAGASGAARRQAVDVHGWGKVTWGMTVAQAKAALGPEAKAAEGENTFTDGYIARLVLKKLKVGDIDMDVSIAAKSGSERIALISLELADKPQDTGSRGAAVAGVATDVDL